VTNLPTLSALAGAVLAVASTTFNAQAEAVHPILDTSTHATGYRAQLSSAFTSGEVEKSIVEQHIDLKGMDLGLLAGGAVTTLEAALKQPADRPRMKVYPPDPRVGEPVVVMTVLPKSVYNTAAIPVCLDQNGQILGKWTISTAGQVSPDFQSVASSSKLAA
jgi:hypothetical protein